MTKSSTSAATGAAPPRRSTRSTTQPPANVPLPSDPDAQTSSISATVPAPPPAHDATPTPSPASQQVQGPAPTLPDTVESTLPPPTVTEGVTETMTAHPVPDATREEGEIVTVPASSGQLTNSGVQPAQSSGKGKAKDTAVPEPEPEPVIPQPRDEDDADLQKELELAKFRSLREAASHSGNPPGESTSATPRRGSDVPPASPSKRQRANTAGDANVIQPRTSTPASSPRIPRYAFNTADGRAPRNGAVAQPEGGWPIRSYSINNILAAVPDEQLAQWRQHREVHGSGVLAYVSGAGGDPAQAVTNLRAAIAGQINVETDEIDIGSPTATESGPLSFVFFVAGSGLTSRLEEAITHTVINVASISASILPFDLTPSGYIGAFRGNHYADTPTGLEAARRDVVASIFGTELVTQHIRDHHEAFGDEYSPAEAVEQAAASVVIRPLALETGSGPQTIYGVWVAPHTNDRREWAYFEALVGCVRIRTTVNGTGTIVRPMQCRICPAVDHPTGLCALPAVPGWRGPTAESVGALEDAAREATRRMREDLRAADARVQTALADLRGGGRLNYQGQSFGNRGGSRGSRGGRGNGRGGRGGTSAKRGDRKGKSRDYEGGGW